MSVKDILNYRPTDHLLADQRSWPLDRGRQLLGKVRKRCTERSRWSFKPYDVDVSILGGEMQR